MHQLNEEVRCLRQTLSHLQYRIKHETDKETKNKLIGDYNSYNLILLNKLKELGDNNEFQGHISVYKRKGTRNY